MAKVAKAVIGAVLVVVAPYTGPFSGPLLNMGYGSFRICNQSGSSWTATAPRLQGRA